MSRAWGGCHRWGMSADVLSAGRRGASVYAVVAWPTRSRARVALCDEAAQLAVAPDAAHTDVHSTSSTAVLRR
jgi:hypothetical protein